MSKFKDRFHLTPEQSLFLAKKKWDENVYCGMKMENRAVTFPQTQTILNVEYWCKLNEYIARNESLEWGKLRTGSVWISGTDYEPPVPEKKKATDELNGILNDAKISATDKALKAFTWGARGQFFWDGNKRTSLLLANKILASSGAGILTITDKYMEQFNSLSLSYYNTGNDAELKQFLYDNAIHGIRF